MRMKSDDQYQEVIRKLETLEPVPPRFEEDVLKGRTAYLRDMESVVGSVTLSPKHRLNHWMENLQPKRLAMSTLTIILIVLVAISTTGLAAVYAALQAIPGENLYGVKIWSEDVRLDLTSDPESAANLHLLFMNRRLEEIQAIAGEGKTEELQTVSRNFFSHFREVEDLAENMEDGTFYYARLSELLQKYNELLPEGETRELNPDQQPLTPKVNNTADQDDDDEDDNDDNDDDEVDDKDDNDDNDNDGDDDNDMYDEDDDD